MNNILITGAAGFLGSKYTEFFSKMHNVYALDINLEKLLSLKKKIKSINIFKIDITNEAQIKKLFIKLKKKKVFINISLIMPPLILFQIKRKIQLL